MVYPRIARASNIKTVDVSISVGRMPPLRGLFRYTKVFHAHGNGITPEEPRKWRNQRTE